MGFSTLLKFVGCLKKDYGCLRIRPAEFAAEEGLEVLKNVLGLSGTRFKGFGIERAAL
jgi:hypothetical protein